MPTQFLEHAGCRLAHEVSGEGPPVLFVQGVGLHGRGWTPQVEALSAEFRCLAFDNRGMGQSRPASRRLSVEQMADDARALMDAQGWEAAHVVGHSLGGLVAAELALAAPARVRSLSLLCTVARGRDATRPTGRMLWIGLRSALGPRRWRRRAFLEVVLSPVERVRGDLDEAAARLEPLFGHDLAVRAPGTMGQLRALRAYDATPRLGRLSGVPTLVLSAAHDPIAPPRYGRALAAAIPGARYVELPDAAHGAPIQCADGVNVLLRDHLWQAERGQASFTRIPPDHATGGDLPPAGCRSAESR
jgi:pimeloyl-ACP methyl ester carboxylesterase